MYIIVMYLLIACFAMIDILKIRYINKRTQIIILGIIFTFLLLRFNMGSDTRTYVKMFNEISQLSLWQVPSYYNTRFPLFSMWMFELHHHGADFAAFQFINNLLIIFMCLYAIYHYSNHYLLSLVILLGAGIIQVYYTSAIRQMICMAIFLVVFYHSIEKNKWWSYYLASIVCFFIHEASVFLLFLPLLYLFQNFLWSKKGFFVIGFIWVTLFSFVNIIPEIFSAYLPLRWANYLELLHHNHISILGLGLQCILISLIIVLYYFTDETYKTNGLKYQIMVCLASFLIYTVFIKMPLMSRVCDFINIIHVIVIPNMLMHIFPAKKVFYGTFLLLILNLFLLVFDTFDGMSHYYDTNPMHYPYVSIFNIHDAYQYYDFGTHSIR